MTALGLTPNDIVTALRAQNIQAAVGRIGAQPMADAELQLNIQTRGPLTEIEEFEGIVVRANPDGSFVRVRDVARVELGARSQDVLARFPGWRRCGLRRPAIAGLERHRRRRRRARGARGPQDPLSGGRWTSHPLRYDRVRPGQHRRGDPQRSSRPSSSSSSWSSLPRQSQGDPDPAHRRAGGADRHLRRHAGFGLLGQTPSSPWRSCSPSASWWMMPSSSSRPSRPSWRAGPSFRGGRHQGGDGRDHGTHHRHHPSSFSRSSAGRLHPRHLGQLYQQFAVAVSVSMVISAINALSLSPALCAVLLKHGQTSKRGPMRHVLGFIDKARDGYAAIVARTSGSPPSASCCSPASSSARAGSPPKCPRASCRPRTRASSSSRCSCRMAPRSTAPWRRSSGSRISPAGHPALPASPRSPATASSTGSPSRMPASSS